MEENKTPPVKPINNIVGELSLSVMRTVLTIGGVLVSGFVARYIVVEIKAKRRTDADMKRQKKKIASMKKREREFYWSILMEFHRMNIKEGWNQKASTNK